MKKYGLILLLFFVFGGIAEAQTLERNFSSFVIKDEINKHDPVDPKLGRFDAYELNAGKGDRVAFELISKKTPLYLLLVSPSGKSSLHVPERNRGEVFLDTVISEAGNWSFYIIADSNKNARYSCTVAFASPHSLELPREKSFCTRIRFLLSLADARFLFAHNNKLIETLFADENIRKAFSPDGRKITVTISDTEANPREITKELKKCLGKDYLQDVVTSHSVRFVENTFKENHFVEIATQKGKTKITVGKEK